MKNLLTFSRQAPSLREPNDLNTVARRAVLLVKHKLDMQNIELEERWRPDLPPVECDANQIQQVILVLMVNASEAMPKGGGLEVSTEFDARDRAGLVRVKDTGSGIPADVLPRIFDPFFTTKEDQNRTGLGLAVAHSIVEQHAGEISVPLHAGRGNGVSGGAAGGRGRRWHGRDSRKRRRFGCAGRMMPMATAVETDTAMKTKGKILIVDDELVVRDSLSKWFTSEGYTARPVGSGREALETIQQAEFDIALHRHQDARHGRHGAASPAARGRCGPDRRHHDRLRVRWRRPCRRSSTAPTTTSPSRWTRTSSRTWSHNALEHKRARREVVRLRENLQEVSPEHGADRQEPGHEEGGGADRDGGAHRGHRADHRGERHGQGSGGARHPRGRPAALHADGDRSTAARSPKRCSKASCSATRRAPSPARSTARRASSKWPTAARCFWTRSATSACKTQTDLLRVLQEKEIVRVGGNQQIKVDFRCIAATNKNLESAGEGRAPSGPTCTTGCTCSASTCRRCASAATTSRCW